MVTSGQQVILFNSIELCCMVLCVFTCISSSAPVAIRGVSLDLFHVWYCILFLKKHKCQIMVRRVSTEMLHSQYNPLCLV